MTHKPHQKLPQKHLVAILLFMFLLSGYSLRAQTTLAQGDLSIIGFSANAPKGIIFVAWKNLAANTEIIFSENGINDPTKASSAAGNQRWQKPYGKWKNTTGASIDAGTIITLGNATASIGTYSIFQPTGAPGTTFTFSNSTGGHVFAYQGGTLPTATSSTATYDGTLLFGLAYQSTTGVSTWLASGPATSPGTCLPLNLTTNNYIFVSGNANVGQYTGVRTGKTVAEYRALVTSLGSWTYPSGASAVTYNTLAFPVDNNKPTATAVTNTGTLQVGQLLTGNYTYTDADAEAEDGSTFKWYRSDNAAGLNKTAIASATTKTYSLTGADLNKYISFEVTPNDGTLAGNAVESSLRGPIITVTLPVVLMQFNVSKELNVVKLSWTTSYERENSKFMIYRSGQEQQYYKLGTIAGAGNSASTNKYNYEDKQPFSGTNYYKLIQVDADGKEMELGIRFLNFGLSHSVSVLYPNPTVDVASLFFDPAKFNSLIVADLNGRKLNTISIDSSATTISIDLSKYPSGIYLLKLIGKQGIETKKVIKK